MRKITFLVFINLISFSLFAQNATLKGTVTEDNGEPAIQANIIIDVNKGWATVTDFDGKYTLNLPAGEYAVMYKYIGKEDQIIKINLVEGETTVQDIAFNEKVEIINTVVVSASKYEKKLSEETVSMEVLKSDLLQSNNITDIEDGMGKVPGVTIVEGQANIRGGSGWSYGAGSRVMILLDDLPLLTADAGDTKWSFLPTENVEQIEVIKGAASSLYGSGALNGVINVRTGYAKNTPETSVGVWSGIYAGPRNKDHAWWYDDNSQPFFTGANFVHKRKVKRLDLVFNGQFRQDSNPLQSNSNGDVRIGTKIRFRPKKVEGLSTGVNVNAYRSWGSAFFLWDGGGDRSRIPMPGTASAYQNNRVAIDPFVSFYDKKNNNFSLKTRFFRTGNRNNTGQGSIATMYQYDLQYNRYFNKADINVVGGLAGYYSTVRSPEKDEASLIGEHNGTNLAPYVQVEKKLFDKRLNLTAGARYEYFKINSLSNDTTLSSDLKRPLFRLGTNFKAAEATFIRASWGEGYRFPSLAELFINNNIGGIGIFPNPGLTPETGWYGELGIKQGVKFGDWGAYIDGAVFINRYNNMMEFNFGQFGVVDLPALLSSTNGLSIQDLGIGFSSQNVGSTSILGMELSVGGQGKIGNFPLNILAGYTYISPKSLDWDKELELYNEEGDNVVPGQSLVETVVGLSAIKGNTPSYAGGSSSVDNVLKYRNKHTFMIDVSTSVKKFDFGVSFQYRSFMESIDQFFVSDFLTGEISDEVLTGTFGDLFNISPEDLTPADYNDPRDPTSNPQYNTVEELIGTNAFSGLKTFREKYNGRGTSILDARVAYNFNDQAKISIVGKNLLNLTYDVRPTLLGDPMNFAFQFNYNFKHKESK